MWCSGSHRRHSGAVWTHPDGLGLGLFLVPNWILNSGSAAGGLLARWFVLDIRLRSDIYPDAAVAFPPMMPPRWSLWSLSVDHGDHSCMTATHFRRQCRALIFLHTNVAAGFLGQCERCTIKHGVLPRRRPQRVFSSWFHWIMMSTFSSMTSWTKLLHKETFTCFQFSHISQNCSAHKPLPLHVGRWEKPQR